MNSLEKAADSYEGGRVPEKVLFETLSSVKNFVAELSNDSTVFRANEGIFTIILHQSVTSSMPLTSKKCFKRRMKMAKPSTVFLKPLKMPVKVYSKKRMIKWKQSNCTGRSSPSRKSYVD